MILSSNVFSLVIITSILILMLTKQCKIMLANAIRWRSQAQSMRSQAQSMRSQAQSTAQYASDSKYSSTSNPARI